MPNEQFDLFAGAGIQRDAPTRLPSRAPAVAPAGLDDAALLAAIPGSGVADGPALATEAGRRRLPAAIPVLEDYCRRFAGFGLQLVLPEQAAALAALAAIGGPDAARSVARIIQRGWAQGPNLAQAAAAAARLGALLPPETVLALLRHAEPGVRADACRLARSGGQVVTTLMDLLTDLHRDVAIEAACALGRMGRPEARPLLRQVLDHGPTTPVIEAIPPIADEDCIDRLARIARGTAPEVAAAAREALDAIDHPRAAQHIRRLQG